MSQHRAAYLRRAVPKLRANIRPRYVLSARDMSVQDFEVFKERFRLELNRWRRR